jgi:hypothetical protein
MMHQTASTRAYNRHLLWLRLAEGVVAIVRSLRPLILKPQQFAPLPNDSIEQLRLERMRARLSYDDLRVSVRRIL